MQEPITAVQGIDELGFLAGWGNTVGRVRESFQLLLDIIQARGWPQGRNARLWVQPLAPSQPNPTSHTRPCAWVGRSGCWVWMACCIGTAEQCAEQLGRHIARFTLV